MDSVSNRLKNLREGQNLKQKEVAEYLGLSQQSYSRYENGMNELPLRYLEPLAMLYRVSSDYILGISISEQDLASISQNVYNDISLENI